MEKIYILQILDDNEIDDKGWIEGVFRTKEKAKESIKNLNRDRGCDDDETLPFEEGVDYEINEYELQ